MISRFYKRYVIEGKKLLIFAIVFLILIRLVCFLVIDPSPQEITSGGYLWKPLAPIFTNPLYSIIGSSFMLIVMAFLVNHINASYAFIRVRTLLPVAFLLLLFTCMPSQLFMSPEYIGALTILFIVGGLFEAYDLGSKQGATFKVSFYLAAGSLFAPMLLLYFPILWICLMRVKSFSFKSFLASLFSIFLLYIPAFSYFLLTDDIDTFIDPFTSLVEVDWGALPVLSYTLPNFLTLAISIVLVFLVIADNSVNSFKDSVRVRAFSFVLTTIILFSILCTLFLNQDTQLTLYIALAVGSLKIAHLFALITSRSMSYVFLAYLFVLIIISIISLYELNI